MTVRQFVTLLDLSKTELLGLLKRASELKHMQYSGIPHEYLKNKTLAMVFEKASTRTRVSFETAMTQLGGASIFASSGIGGVVGCARGKSPPTAVILPLFAIPAMSSALSSAVCHT